MNKVLLAINVKMKVENVPVGHMLLVTNATSVNQDILVSQIANVCIAVFGIQLFLKISKCSFLNVTPPLIHVWSTFLNYIFQIRN